MVDKTFASLLPRVNQSVIGCPQPLIIQYIRSAAIRSCERSLLWRYVQPKFNLSPGISEYQYRKPDNADVHVVFEALMNDVPLERLTLEQAIAYYPKWADLYSGVDPETMWDARSSAVLNIGQFDGGAFNAGPTFTVTEEALADGEQPRAICQLTPDKYIILPLPDDKAVYTMRMFYALKPKRDATSMDANMMDELEDLIIHGALQQLLVMPNVAWTDFQLASYHAKQYLFHSTERRARANLSNLRGQFTVRGNPFA